MLDVALWGIALFVLLIGVSIVWSTLLYAAPPIPSSQLMRVAVCQLVLRVWPSGPIIEMGAGWGGLAVSLARTFPNRQIIAVEISLCPYLVLCLRAGALNNLTVVWGDGGKIIDQPNMPTACIVTYLTGPIMRRLTKYVAPNMAWVSIHFAVPGRIPIAQITVPDIWKTKVFAYAANPA